MHLVNLATMGWLSIVLLVVLYAMLRVALRKVTSSWSVHKKLAVCQAIAAVPTALACWYLYDIAFAIGFLGVQVGIIAFRQYAFSHGWM